MSKQNALDDLIENLSELSGEGEVSLNPDFLLTSLAEIQKESEAAHAITAKVKQLRRLMVIASHPRISIQDSQLANYEEWLRVSEGHSNMILDHMFLLEPEPVRDVIDELGWPDDEIPQPVEAAADVPMIERVIRERRAREGEQPFNLQAALDAQAQVRFPRGV